MDTPLLASDEDGATPLLASGPDLEQNESRLAQLMRRPSHPMMDSLSIQETSPSRPPSPPEVSIVTIVAGTLAMVQCGLVWGSFLSDSWSDTFLRASIGWQQKYLPFLDDYTDTIIQTTDLASILSILRTSKQYVMLIVVAVTSVLIPCVAMISNPMAILQHYYTGVTAATTSFELFMRSSYIIVYFLIFLDLSTSFITLEWTDTVLTIHNRMHSGVFFYLLGITASLGVVVVLRHSKEQSRQGVSTTRLPPPAEAFRYSWPSSDVDHDEMIGIMRTRGNDDNDTLSEQQQQPHSLQGSCWIWQTGLIASVLLLPAFVLPLLSISYQGVAAQFMPASHQTLYIWQVPWLLWQYSSTNKVLLAICGLVLVLQAMIIPLAALACGLILWLHPQKSRQSSKWLYCLHPFMNGMALAVTIVLFAPTLQPFANTILNQTSSGLCDKFEENNVDCLTLVGRILPGTWCFLAHSSLLEIFVIATLRCTSSSSKR